jgi:uncharacterized SAM-binding protein YcdF (DUF218 family)
LFLPSVRTPVLGLVGTALVAEDPVAPVDMIVIGPDLAEAGVLEAADLVQGGIAIRVIVLADPMTTIAQEFARRGVSYEAPPVQLRRLLHGLGVEQVELLRFDSGGTEAAARLLAEWCARQKVHSIVVVTGADHSRRFRRVLRRSMNGTPTRVIVRVSHYSAFGPDRWWQHRGTLRTGLVEIQKLILDVARHPLS